MCYFGICYFACIFIFVLLQLQILLFYYHLVLQIVKELGGELVTSITECTHLVTDQVSVCTGQRLDEQEFICRGYNINAHYI